MKKRGNVRVTVNIRRQALSEARVTVYSHSPLRPDARDAVLRQGARQHPDYRRDFNDP
jgi:hypothetical protein